MLVTGYLAGSPGAGHAAMRLDATHDNPVSVDSDYQYTPNGQWIVYRGSSRNGGPKVLHCLAASGGMPTRLNGNQQSVRSIDSWQLNPDGSRVVYFADQEVPGLTEVYVVPLPNGEFYKVNDALVESGSKGGAFAGTAGDRVAYVAGKVTGPFTGTFYELFSVPAAGGESVRLNGPMVNGGDVQKIVVRADGGRVLYLADQDIDEKLELYSVAPSGGTPVKLNPAMNDLSDVLPDGVSFSPDGNRVIFQIDHRPDMRVELYSVSSLGGAATPLNPSLPAGGDVTRGSQRFSPNGARVLYHADQNADEVFEIFSVPSGGGTSVRLNGPLVTFGDVKAAGLQFSPDSTRVLYTADQFIDEMFELFSVPSAGGTAVKLSGDMVTGGDVVDDAVFSPDSSRILFRADRRVDEVVELFSTSSAGGVPTLLNPPMVQNGDVIRATFTPDGSEVVYLADQDVDEVFELYAVAASGGAARKLSGPLVAGGDVLDWKFSPDGSRLVYRADQEIDELYQLFAVELNEANETLAGDFTRNGVVDAADYTKWRDGLGSNYTAADYTTWKTNFGRRTGAGASAPGSAGGKAATVPEPASILGLLAAMFCGGCCRLNRANPSPPAAREHILPSRS